MIVDYGKLLNQNIKIIKVREPAKCNGDINEKLPDAVTYKFINSNGMELCTIKPWTDATIWINPGGFMTKEEYDKYKAKEELHKINVEMINEE